MSFSDAVRETVLTRSARRCCVCREFKGVALEVHHIHPAADGGPDTLENAILLCFDCHAAAGHYNPKHPKGSKFSPAELRIHRDNFWKIVAAGLVPTLPKAIAVGVHVQHLVCLSETEAPKILAGHFHNPHFDLRRMLQSPISTFMSQVLNDDLPHAPESVMRGVSAAPGVVHTEQFWTDHVKLVAAYPEFADKDSRPVTVGDLDSGLLPGRLFRACVQAGLPPEELGSLNVDEVECGGPGWVLSFRVRRPIFLFTIVRNLNDAPIVILQLTGCLTSPTGAAPRALETIETGDLSVLPFSPVTLMPGESLGLASAILLTPPDEDDLAYAWEDIQHGDDPGRVTVTGFTDETARLGPDAYRLVGPTFRLKNVEIACGDQVGTVDSRPFDIRRVHLIDDSWLMGSCPHAVYEMANGELRPAGEILCQAWGRVETETLIAPPGAVRLHVREFEFETTTLSSVTVDGRACLTREAVLHRGDGIAFDVVDGSRIEIEGQYDSHLNAPATERERRSKRSLVAAGLRVLASTETEAAIAAPLAHCRSENAPASG